LGNYLTRNTAVYLVAVALMKLGHKLGQHTPCAQAKNMYYVLCGLALIASTWIHTSLQVLHNTQIFMYSQTCVYGLSTGQLRLSVPKVKVNLYVLNWQATKACNVKLREDVNKY